MNKSIIVLRAVLLCASTLVAPCFAGTIVTGSGTTYEEALSDAKVRALEHDAGAFVIHKSATTNTDYAASTAQYTGGVVHKYVVLSTFNRAGLVYVKIDADIKRNKNNVIRSEDSADWRSDLSVSIDEQRAQETFQHKLADQPLFQAHIRDVKSTVQQANVTMVVKYELKWSPKFLSDLAEYTSLAGKKVELSNDGGILYAAAAVVSAAAPIFTGTAFQVARTAHNQPHPTSAYAVCYGTQHTWAPDRTCVSLQSPIDRLSNNTTGRLNILLSTGERKEATFPIHVDQLYVATHNGRKIYFPSSGKQQMFPKGAVIFTEGNLIGTVTITLPAADAKQLAALEIETN